MPQDPPIKPGTPSKNAENQDAATMSASRPSTSEELEARAGRPATPPARRDGDPFDQSDRATDEAVRERAEPSPSRLNDGNP